MDTSPIQISKAIIFDADGVVIDSELLDLEKFFGISREAMAGFFTTEFQECLIGQMDLKEALSQYLKKMLWHGSVDDLLHYWFK